VAYVMGCVHCKRDDLARVASVPRGTFKAFQIVTSESNKRFIHARDSNARFKLQAMFTRAVLTRAPFKRSLQTQVNASASLLR